MRYTLRNVPDSLDSLLRERARAEDKSLNQVAIDALVRGTVHGAAPVRLRDLGDIAGTWVSDPETDRALENQDTVDEDLWT